MWTEVVIYLPTGRIQKPQRFFDGNRSRLVLPHLDGSDVIPPHLLRVRLKPLCGASINLLRVETPVSLPAAQNFIRKHQHWPWNVASVCRSRHTRCGSGGTQSRGKWAAVLAAVVCGMHRIIGFWMLWKSSHVSQPPIPIWWRCAMSCTLSDHIVHSRREHARNVKPTNYFDHFQFKQSSHQSFPHHLFAVCVLSELSWTKPKLLFSNPWLLSAYQLATVEISGQPDVLGKHYLPDMCVSDYYVTLLHKPPKANLISNIS